MFCSKCGEQNSDDGSFCKKCGASLKPSGQGGGLPSESATGLEPNIAGALCYGLWWITGLVFFLLEKEDRFVRFHAMQSIIVFGAITGIQIVISVLALITIVFVVLNWLVWIGSVVLWIFLMIKAYQGERYMLPKVGEIAEKYI